jgi:dCMP deaminase
MDRISKVRGWLEVAKSYALRSPCSRRKFGAIIVKNGVLIGAGYNGTARGALNCGIDVPCIKEIANEPANLSYNYCPAVHAEENAIINSNPQDRIGGTMYLAPTLGSGDRPCFNCRRRILNAQIHDIYYLNSNEEIIHEYVDSFVALEDDWIYKKLDEANPDWESRLI